MLQQLADIAKSLGQYASRKSVFIALGTNVLCQSGQQVHVFSEACGDVWLYDLENAAFPPACFTVEPGKSNYRADTGFKENSVPHLYMAFAQARAKFTQNDGANLLGFHI